MQRFSRERLGRVKYSTLCPSRRDSPSEARRAIPTKGGLSGGGNIGKDFMRSVVIRFLFAYSRLPGGRSQGPVFLGSRRSMKVSALSRTFLGTLLPALRRARHRSELESSSWKNVVIADQGSLCGRNSVRPSYLFG